MSRSFRTCMTVLLLVVGSVLLLPGIGVYWLAARINGQPLSALLASVRSH